MLVNMNFNKSRCFVGKRILEKAATIKRFSYAPLSKVFEQTKFIKK